MINFKIILNVLGYLLIALSLVMLIPVMIDLGMGNDTWKSFITSAIITFGFGVTFLISTRNEENNKISKNPSYVSYPGIINKIKTIQLIREQIKKNDKKYYI